MKTYIIVDSKLMAYTASFQRQKPILATLDHIETAVKFMVDNYINDDYQVVMGFDFGKSRHRKELLTSYKGHRPEGVAKKSIQEQEAYDKFQDDYRQILPELTTALGIKMIGVEGVEFDDLGSILANTTKHNVILLTEDHDFFQVPLEYPDRVRQFMPKSFKLLTASDITDLELVEDKEEFLVAKAIKGDSGDSIKGLTQCGPVCFEKWLKPLQGATRTRGEWKTLFCALARSSETFSIHSDYDVDTFEALFDLNISLGETMVDTRFFNEQELIDYNACLSAPLDFNQELFFDLYTIKCDKEYSDFGDVILPSTYPYLRGVRYGG